MTYHSYVSRLVNRYLPMNQNIVGRINQELNTLVEENCKKFLASLDSGAALDKLDLLEIRKESFWDGIGGPKKGLQETLARVGAVLGDTKVSHLLSEEFYAYFKRLIENAVFDTFSSETSKGFVPLKVPGIEPVDHNAAVSASDLEDFWSLLKWNIQHFVFKNIWSAGTFTIKRLMNKIRIKMIFLPPGDEKDKYRGIIRKLAQSHKHIDTFAQRYSKLSLEADLEDKLRQIH